MRRLARIPLLLSVLTWAASPAGRAESDTFASGFYTRGVETADYMDQGGAVFNPFYIPARTGALLPRVTLAVTHEDNVFLEPDDGTAATMVNLAAGLLALWGRPAENHVYGDYGVGLPLYNSEKEIQDQPSHMLRLGVVYHTPKSRVNGQAGFRRLEDADLVVGARVVRQDYFGDLSVEHRLSGKSSAGVVGRVERHEYDNGEYVDYDRYYGAGRLYHRLTPKSEGFIQGGLGRDEPQDSAAAASAADFLDLSLGVRGKQSPKFSSSGRVGYMWRTYDLDTRGTYEHWIASLAAHSSPFGLTTLGAELYADVRPAVDETGVDTVDQGVVGTASRRLFTERLQGNASVTFGRVDYHGASAAGGDERVFDGRSDNYWGFTLGMDWWTKQHCSLGLAYSYQQRDGSREADSETQAATSYEYGRWTLRASWNY